MKKRSILIALLLAVSTMIMSLTGCSKPYDIEDGYELIQTALAESLTAETYYVSEYTGLGDNKSITYSLNVQAGNKEDYDATQIKYTVKRAETTKQTIDEYTYTYSLPKNVKARKAKAEDYKYYLFTVVGNKKTKKETPQAMCYSVDEINRLTLSNILIPLQELQETDIDFTASNCGIKKEGKNTYIRFKVTNSEHTYAAYESIEILLFNDKIVKIGTYGKAEADKDKFKIDIVYQGPKITPIAYDTDEYQLVSE